MVPPRNLGSEPFPSIFFLNERHFQDFCEKREEAGSRKKRNILKKNNFKHEQRSGSFDYIGGRRAAEKSPKAARFIRQLLY